MSDYIFSAIKQPENFLANEIQKNYQAKALKICEFHGNWGSLAVSKNLYNGFLPYENEQHIFIVIGGPVLYFTDNDFLTNSDSNQASELLYRRWLIEKNMNWADNLSGPFSILLIDKKSFKVTVISDLMGFVPTYSCIKSQKLFLSTHVDLLARVTQENNNIDQVSVADFLLNDVVTYPHTIYTNIWQQPPASIVQLTMRGNAETRSYWSGGGRSLIIRASARRQKTCALVYKNIFPLLRTKCPKLPSLLVLEKIQEQ